MPHVNQTELIRIITEAPASGSHINHVSWQPCCWINLDGNAIPQHFFEIVSPTLYVDMLIHDTIDVVDFYIEQMVGQPNNGVNGNL